jgi:hypothetical protein
MKVWTFQGEAGLSSMQDFIQKYCGTRQGGKITNE